MAKVKTDPIEIVVKGVKEVISNKEGKNYLEVLEHHERVCRGKVSDPMSWHVVPYSHRGFKPTYQIRKFDGRGDKWNNSIHLLSMNGSVRIAGLIAMLLNGYEALTGHNLIDWLQDDG